MYKIDEIKMLRLGQRDENLARSLPFDCSDWLEQYPEASIHILFRRPGESAIVPMSTTLEGTTLTWLIHDFEVGKTGVGNAEFRAVDTAGLRRKSRIIPCSIEETLLGDDETVLYTQDQVDETLAHISEAAQAAQAAKASEEAAALSAQNAAESATSASAAASVATSARDAAQAAQAAAETAQHQAEAAQSGVHADAEAAEQAKVAAQAAQASAQGAASQASADRTAAESARADAEAAATHAEAVVDGIDQAGADQVADVNAAGQAQVSAVNQAGTTQVNAVQAKGTQVINSIPADYSALTDEVTGLKSAFDAAVDMMTDEYIVDYSRIATVRCVINSSGNWNATSGTNLGTSSTIEIPNGANKIILKANSSIGSLWALLKTYDPSALTGAVDFCTQYTGRQVLTVDTEIEIDIPDDAKFLYVQRSPSAGTDQTPSKVAFKSAVVTKNEFIPRGNIVPNYIREYDNTYYSASSAGVAPSSGSSSLYGTLVIPVMPSTKYSCNLLRFLTLGDADGLAESASLNDVTEFTTGANTKIIWATYYKAENTKDNLIISSGDYLDSETGVYEIPWLYDPNKNVISNISDRVFGIIKPYSAYRGSDQSYMFEKPNSIKRDKMLCFTCDFTALGSLEIGLAGPSGGNVIGIVLDGTQIKVKRSGTETTGVNHGLTISDRLSVIMRQTVDGYFEYEVSSNGVKYSNRVVYANGFTRPYYVATDMSISNVAFDFTCRDFSADIWMFGDSYFSYGENRWPYYLITDGFSDHCLIDGYAGEASERALPSLKSYISQGKPKYIVWCLGMNDGSDGSSAPKAAWMSAVNEILGICKDNQITPVFATIPTVPTINHEQKNAWIRNSGYQFIDFAKAVGAQADGTWFNGMLSSDGVHPTVSGAMALYYQALADFPQFLQN